MREGEGESVSEAVRGGWKRKTMRRYGGKGGEGSETSRKEARESGRTAKIRCDAATLCNASTSLISPRPFSDPPSPACAFSIASAAEKVDPAGISSGRYRRAETMFAE